VKRFEFRLDPVLRWKAQKERMAELQQQQARQRLDKALAEAAALKAALIAIGEELESRIGRAATTTAWTVLREQAAFIAGALSAVEGRVRQAENKLHEANAARVRASTEVEALKVLEAEQRHEHQRKTARATQNDLDELALRLWRAAPSTGVARAQQPAEGGLP